MSPLSPYKARKSAMAWIEGCGERGLLHVMERATERLSALRKAKAQAREELERRERSKRLRRKLVRSLRRDEGAPA